MAVVLGILFVPSRTVGECIARHLKNSNETPAFHVFGLYDGHGDSQDAYFYKCHQWKWGKHLARLRLQEEKL